MLQFYSSLATPKLLSHFGHCSLLSTSSPSSLSSSPRIRLIWLNQSYSRRTRAFCSAAVADSVPKKTGSDTFFAEDNVSWKSLGLSDRVSQALFNAGFNRPSLVQVLWMNSYAFLVVLLNQSFLLIFVSYLIRNVRLRYIIQKYILFF